MIKYIVEFDEGAALRKFVLYLNEKHIPYDKDSNWLRVVCPLAREDLRHAILTGCSKIRPHEYAAYKSQNYNLFLLP